MPLTTEDGAAVDIDALTAANQEFARSMAAPPADEPQTPAPPRKVEGATAKRRGRPPGGADKARSAKTATAPGTDTRTPQKASEERAAGIAGIVQTGGSLAALLGKNAKPENEALLADGVTLAMYAQPLGAAVADVADKDARFAKVIDRLCIAGPYSALMGVMFGMGTQLMANHSEKKIPGTMTRAEVLATLDEADEKAA
jgi:hypothetical protein